jgi:predicted RNA-binding Zn-ribbon protein involved in translation (DUF1610 family)
LFYDREMEDERPTACSACGRTYRPGQVLVSFERCTCSGRSVGGGHTCYICRHCGWQARPGCETPGEQLVLPGLLLGDS